MKKFLLLFTLVLAFSTSLLSETIPSDILIKSISGTVYDSESGETLIGASVIIKGTDNGTTTDIDGKFQLDANEGDVLVISYTGFTNQEITVDGQTNYEIRLSSGVNLQELVVIGSRGKSRTDVERPVPVDVVEAKELRSTGQTDLGQMVQYTSPSFNSAKYGVNGTTNYADPASLRGMGPDQSLVLVNGKRRHQFSTLNLNVAPGLGNVVTDLNSLPAGAVKRMEVLRDGAAAQYGSDAIAGIINMSLNDQADGGTFQTTFGGHNSTPDDDASMGRRFKDGFTIKNSLNYGFDLGKEGSYFNFTLEHFKFAGTNRSDYYSGGIYPDAPVDSVGNFTGPTEDYPYFTTDPRKERGVYPQEDFVVGNYGSNENETRQLFANVAYPVGNNMKLYAFGGYSDKDILAYGFFRNPARFSRAVLTVFPDGYVPRLPGQSTDWSVAAGLSRELSDSWNFDLSYSKGHNDLELWNNNSTNPSLGSATPTEFYVGQYWFEQDIISADVSKNLGAVGSLEGLNLAFGAQYRKDRYQQFLGSPESYQVGPLAEEKGKDIGASARPGIQDANDLSRSNVGIYADVEADISEALLLTGAVRFENYSDFGGNLSGKLAARYKIKENFAVRGSFNRGFRAPSLAQLGTVNNTSTVQNGAIVITRQVPSADERLAKLGIEDPKAEISDNINLGLTAKLADGALLLTVDAYQITIDERIVISERLNASKYPAVAALFPNEKEIRFFTNHIDTKTQGIDLVASYKKLFAEDNFLNISLAATFNKTEVTGQKDTPAEILAGAADTDQGLKLLGQTAKDLIEVAVPRQKILLSANYQIKKFGIAAKMTRFGEVKAFSKGLSEEDNNVECVDGRCVQTYSAKTVTDLSLTYKFSDSFSLTAGSNNIFDVYPDKYNTSRNGFVGSASSYASGQIPYSRNSNQFGFNGAYYYITGILEF